MIRFLKSLPIAFLLSSVVCCLSSGFASDAVEPASATVTSLRGEAIVAISQSSFFEGTTLRLTNCSAYAGTTTNSVRQGLSNVVIEVRVGSLTTNVPYSGSVASATNGAWWCDIQIPTNLSSVYLQVKLTDSITNSYIYPWKVINISQPLD